MPPKKAVEKDEAAAQQMVLDYLVQQNRPYNGGDIFTNLHEQVGKAVLLRVLKNLVTENKIKEKAYGKQTIYYADQGQFEKADTGELDRMDQTIDKLKEEVETTQKTVSQLETELKQLESEPGTQEAKTQLAALRAENEQAKNKLDKLRSSDDTITETERDRICAQYDGYVKEWRRRKRMATDVLDAILENYPKSKKILFDEIGIVTDEEAKVDIKTF